MQKKRMFQWLLLGLLLVTGFFPYRGYATDPETVTFILHKRVLVDESITDPQTSPSNGKQLTENELANLNGLGLSVPYNGATFHVYHLTDYYLQSQEDAQALAKRLGQMNPIQIEQFIAEQQLEEVTGSPVLTQTHAEFGEGVGVIDVPRKHNGHYGIYLIVEDHSQQTSYFNVTNAAPIMIGLPLMDPLNEVELTQIHLYPKNAGYFRQPYFYKYGKEEDTEQTEPLEGVIFSLFRYNEAGEKIYLAQNQEALGDVWKQSDDPLNDEAIATFISDAAGRVKIADHFLIGGEYYFEELQTLPGYEISEENRQIPLFIPNTWKNESGEFLFMTLNEQKMSEPFSDEQDESIEKGPRIYNISRAGESQKDDDLPTDAGGEQGGTATGTEQLFNRLLPRTAEMRQALAILGIALLLLAYLLRKYMNKTRREEDD